MRRALVHVKQVGGRLDTTKVHALSTAVVVAISSRRRRRRARLEEGPVWLMGSVDGDGNDCGCGDGESAS